MINVVFARNLVRVEIYFFVSPATVKQIDMKRYDRRAANRYLPENFIDICSTVLGDTGTIHTHQFYTCKYK